MDISAVPDLANWLIHPAHWADSLQTIHFHLPIDLAVLGDKPLEDNLGSNVQKAFNNFVKSGQVWAFLIGIILGYLFRSFTSYG